MLSEIPSLAPWEEKGRIETFGAAFDNSAVADSPYCHWPKLSGLITTIYAHKRPYPLPGTPKVESSLRSGVCI